MLLLGEKYPVLPILLGLGGATALYWLRSAYCAGTHHQLKGLLDIGQFVIVGSAILYPFLTFTEGRVWLRRIGLGLAALLLAGANYIVFGFSTMCHGLFL